MHHKTKLKGFTALATGLLSATFLMASPTFADEDKFGQTIEGELQDLGTMYKVVAPNKELSRKAMVTFHSNLLETSDNKLEHVMTLTPEEVKSLKSFGFNVALDSVWAIKYTKQRMKQLQVKPAAPGEIAPKSIPGFACYPTVEETYASADTLAANYPSLATYIDIGNSWKKTTSLNGYDLKVLKITNQAVTGDKPKMFIHSAMHAREYTTATLTLEFATQLLNNYGTDADATWIIDNHEVHILFHMNPDGRKQAETGLYWRKNTNENYCSPTSSNRGADLNRNFTHSWNVTGGGGSSGNVCSAVYRGPIPASEPETMAVENYVRTLFPDRRGPNDSDAAPTDTQGLHLDIHSYSELMLWPWGHTNSVAPNGTALQTLGRKLAYWNGYEPIQSVGLYPTDGTSDSVSYGELGVPNYTYELGTAFFQDCNTYENTIKPDNLPSLEYAAKIIRAPYLTPAGPEVYGVDMDGAENQDADVGDMVALSATANDARYENQNGTEPSQNVTEAEYYIDSYPWQSGATAYAMSASDGNFNSNSEGVSATIDTTGLSEGQHMIYVRAKDATGQWGAGSAGFLTLTNTAPNVPPVARWWYRCEDLTCLFAGGRSEDVDGYIDRYYWWMKPGTSIWGAAPSITYTYDDYGVYKPFLTVRDDDGDNNRKRRKLTLAPPGSAANPTGVIEGYFEE